MKNLKSYGLRRVAAAILSLLLALLVGLYAALFLVSNFFDEYKIVFQAPIVLQLPVVIQKRYISTVSNPGVPKNAPNKGNDVKKTSKPWYPTVSDTDSEKALILAKKHGDLLWRVYGLESTWGKNDACKNSGKYNGFGYGQNTSSWNCFDSFEEVVEKVNTWFDKRFKEGMAEAPALCYYNTGVKEVNCKYYQNYLTL